AGSEREVMMLLDQKGLFPVRIQPVKTIKVGGTGGKRVKGRILCTIYSQLADLLHSGVPLLRSIEILERQSSTPMLTAVLKDIQAKIADGTSLADAMAGHPKV